MSDREQEPAVALCIRGLGRGGAERLVFQEARHLQDAGTAVEVWYQVAGEFVPELQASGIPTHRVGVVDARRRMRDLLASHPSLVVHTHSPSLGGMLRLAATRLDRVRFIHTEHNLVSSYRPGTRALHRLTAGRIDELVAVSHAVLVAAPPARSRRVVYHVDLETDRMRSCLAAPYRATGAHRVVCVASLTPKKDHANLLRAVELLDPSLAEPLWVGIVGDGPLRAEIEALADQVTQRCSRVRVELLGVRDDVPELLATSDVLVLPSLSEGLPLIVIEAMAASTPVVATSVGGVPELVDDGRSGLLVPAGDAAALADALGTLLQDDDLRRRLADQGHATVLGLAGPSWPETYRTMIAEAVDRP